MHLQLARRRIGPNQCRVRRCLPCRRSGSGGAPHTACASESIWLKVGSCQSNSRLWHDCTAFSVWSVGPFRHNYFLFSNHYYTCIFTISFICTIMETLCLVLLVCIKISNACIVFFAGRFFFLIVGSNPTHAYFSLLEVYFFRSAREEGRDGRSLGTYKGRDEWYTREDIPT